MIPLGKVCLDWKFLATFQRVFEKCLMAGNWYFYGRIVKDQPSKEKEKIKNGSYGFLRKVLFYFAYILMYGTNTSRDLRVVAFYQVCRNLKTEQALKHIWPSYVFRIIERLVNRIKNN